MGLLFSKLRNKRKLENSLLLDNLVSNQFEPDIDYDTNINMFDNHTNPKNITQLEEYNKKLIKTISYLQQKINLFELEQTEKLEEYNLSNQNNLYTINEQINLIHKDLTLLLNNDKILIEKCEKLEKPNNYEQCNNNYLENQL
jgi:hypothetical protein